MLSAPSVVESKSSSPVSLPVSSMVVAEHIRWARDCLPEVLPSLVYLCHAWMLGLRDEPLISESICVTDAGPIAAGLDDNVCAAEHAADMSQGQREVIQMVVEAYGNLSAEQLSDLTHEKESPWYSGRVKLNGVIPKVAVQAHFAALAKEAEEDLEAMGVK